MKNESEKLFVLFLIFLVFLISVCIYVCECKSQQSNEPSASHSSQMNCLQLYLKLLFIDIILCVMLVSCNMQYKHWRGNCHWYISCDVYRHWAVATISETLDMSTVMIHLLWAMFGNHDLHQWNLKQKCVKNWWLMCWLFVVNQTSVLLVFVIYLWFQLIGHAIWNQKLYITCLLAQINLASIGVEAICVAANAIFSMNSITGIVDLYCKNVLLSANVTNSSPILVWKNEFLFCFASKGCGQTLILFDVGRCTRGLQYTSVLS